MPRVLKRAYGRSMRLLYMRLAMLLLSDITRRFSFMQSLVYPYIPIVFIGIAFCPVFLSV